MTVALDTIHAEHGNMGRLLGVLEEQIDLFEQAGQPDYELIKEIVDYFLTFPNLCHHPKENLIFRKLQKRNPKAAALIGNLELEHEEISAELNEFAHAVINVLMEVEVRRDTFVKLARDFIADEHRHMVHEEENFMPTARKYLLDEDWAQIEKQTARLVDPLGDDNERARFTRLAELLPG